MGVGWEDCSRVSLFRCTLLSSLLLVCSIHETEQNSYCQQIITERHLDHLQELADTQMQQPGTVSFRFISKMRLSDSVCYVKAAFPLLGTILNRTTFKENSTNANKMKTVRKMYENIDENVDPCIRDEDDEEHALSEMCFEEFTTSPYEMLVLVRQFFQDIKQLLQNKETFEKDCSQVYRSACAGPRQHSSSPGPVLPPVLVRVPRCCVCMPVEEVSQCCLRRAVPCHRRTVGMSPWPAPASDAASWITPHCQLRGPGDGLPLVLSPLSCCHVRPCLLPACSLLPSALLFGAFALAGTRGDPRLGPAACR
uniref:Colony stimulating factor 1 n=1 Tax=Gallus gallus TaxID=9031 RepID=A0A8V1AFP5_CHICK